MLEEVEIVSTLEKSKEVLKKYPELKEMNSKEALAYLTEKKVDYDYLGVLSVGNRKCRKILSSSLRK